MKSLFKEVLEKAYRGNFALGAFNACDVVTFTAIVTAAKKLKAPVIIETSPGETAFLGARNFVSLVENAREEGVVLFTNLDHAGSIEEIKVGLAAGYDLVHFDGSKLPFEENLKQTTEVVSLAHGRGLLVEGEIDRILGHSQAFDQSPESFQAAGLFTDPQKSASFLEKTGVDLLAVFIGNIHGAYSSPIRLDLERLKALRNHLSCYFSLHGGSGTDEGDLRAAITSGGVVKVNVNTDLRVAYRKALDRSLAEKPDEVVGYKIFAPVVEAVSAVVEEKIRLFGSDGKA